MKGPNCFICIHQPVCKSWARWESGHTYKNDNMIRIFHDGLAHLLTKTCAFYSEKKIATIGGRRA